MRPEHLAQFLGKPREHKRRAMARYDQMMLFRLNRGDLGKPYPWRQEQREIHRFNRQNDGHYD